MCGKNHCQLVFLWSGKNQTCVAFIKHLPNTKVCGKRHTCLKKKLTCVSFSKQVVLLFVFARVFEFLIIDIVYYIYGWNFSGRTEPHFGVIFFVFLSTFFGNLEVCDVKTCNIFWKYMSATWSTCLCLDHSSIGGLFNCPYILRPYMGIKCMGN